jgi:hypothetical protein
MSKPTSRSDLVRPLPNGTRVTVNRWIRPGTLTAQDDQRGAVAFEHPCPYCGTGPCLESPRTANGADVERWYRIHPARGIPARFRTHVRPLDEIHEAAEH